MRSFLLVMLLATACGGSVQVIEHTRNAGAISVAGSDESARSRADEFMRAHCRGDYTLVDERPVSNGWQMAYRCEPQADTTHALAPEARVESFVVTR